MQALRSNKLYVCIVCASIDIGLFVLDWRLDGYAAAISINEYGYRFDANAEMGWLRYDEHGMRHIHMEVPMYTSATNTEHELTYIDIVLLAAL